MAKSKKTKKRGGIRHSTEAFAIQLWHKLLVDFRELEGPTFASGAEAALNEGPSVYRRYNYPEVGDVDPMRFKRYKQLESLLNKFIFTNDAYTEDERRDRSVEKFLLDQERLSQPCSIGLLEHRVVSRARKIVRDILGPYDSVECVEKAKFGRRSSIGCPLSLAYIDVKLSSVDAFTSSERSFRWFAREVLSKDHHMADLVRGNGLMAKPQLRKLDYLKLVCVPKKWKVDRVITPLPLIDLFYSYGYGRMVTDRLKAAGLDIRTLQHKHRKLVKGFSLTCSHVTADLSAASDSITSELLNRILPREWYVALKPIIARKVLYADRCYATNSVLPMGNGSTFPLETLIFYSLIRAIGDLAGVQGIYSVYGDDLIYPRRIHRYVCRIFPALHFRLNLDKTFCNYPFRESCGSDYYRGLDVRPAYLQQTNASLTPTQYQAYLYKTYNVLRRRWHEGEIPKACSFILNELARISPICQVPPDFPETAGIRVEDPGSKEIPWYLPHHPVSCYFTHGSRWFQFVFLMESTKDRYVLRQEPYYWLSLQGLTDDDVKYDNFWDTDYSVLRGIQRRHSMNWVKIQYHKHFVDARGVKRTRKAFKSKAVVPSRVRCGYKLVTKRISVW